MAKSVFKHQDDDGDLSIFANDGVVVLACEHDHYWVLSASQHTSDTVKSALEEVLPAGAAEMMLKAL